MMLVIMESDSFSYKKLKRNITIVDTQDKDAARLVALKKALKNDHILLECAYGIYEGMGYDEDGDFFDRRSKMTNEYYEDCVIKNIGDFFAERPDYRKIYIDYYKSLDFSNGTARSNIVFSKNMILFILLNLSKESTAPNGRIDFEMPVFEIGSDIPIVSIESGSLK